MAFKLFRSPSYNKSVLTKSDLVRISNQRFYDLPRIASLNIAPFRSTEKEVHAGMTGRDRREIAPFLWVALMGLQPSTNPDDDTLLQAALLLNEVQIHLRGVNLPRSSRVRTSQQIEDLKNLCFDAGVTLSQSVSVPISTKFHRTMRHIGDHLHLFGCSRLGESEENEAMHKPTKQSYNATNKKADIIGPQLLAVRPIAQADPKSYSIHGNDFEGEYISSVLLLSTPNISGYPQNTRYEEV